MALPKGERQSHYEDLEFRPCMPRRSPPPHHSHCQAWEPLRSVPHPGLPDPTFLGTWDQLCYLISPRSKAASGGSLSTLAGVLALMALSVFSYKMVFMLQRTCVTCPVVAGLELEARVGTPSRCPPPVLRGGRLGAGDVAHQEAQQDSLLCRLNGEGPA